MSDENLSEADIFSAASEPARDDQGRFAAPSEREPDPTPQDTVPAAQERPTPNLGQIAGEEAARGQPDPQQPQRDPREAGILRDLQEERRQRKERDTALAERDRQLAEMQGAMRQMQAMFGQMQGQGRQPQPPQEEPKAPDPFEDPQGFAAFQAQQVFAQRFQPFAQQYQEREQSLARQLQGLQRGMAMQQFGAETAREAEEAFNTAAARGTIDPLEHRRIQTADNPYAAAVEWHRRQRTFERVGHDPEKWFSDEFQRRAQEDPAFKQQMFELLNGQARQSAGAAAPAASRPDPVFTGLPSLTAAPGTSGRDASPVSEADIFNSAPPKMGGRR